MYKSIASVQRNVNSTISRNNIFTPFEFLTGMKLWHKADQKVKEMLYNEHIDSIMIERENRVGKFQREIFLKYRKRIEIHTIKTKNKQHLQTL